MLKKASKTFEAICMDYQRNLPAPNKRTNEICHKRQLTCIPFNIDVLSMKDSFFYCYDETIAKKGAYEETSKLHKFCMNRLCPDVIVLKNSTVCACQNKHFTVFRFIQRDI